MFSFDFANRLYLLGALAAAIPLVIHLSRSRRTKKIVFSTTRFFTDQFLRSYRMSRLKEIFLLALRMALFAFLATALAQPFVRPKGAAALAGGGPRTVVLVLDDSASMGYKEDDVTLFQRAREAASSVLRALGPDDLVALVMAGDQAAGPEVLAEPTAQFEEVARLLDKARPGSLSTDLSGAVARAEELASAARARGATAVYVFSDMQEAGWSPPASPGVREGNLDTAYYFVSVRPKKEPVNRAVTALKYGATRPRVGVPFSVQSLVALVGDDRRDVSVRFHVDGEKVGAGQAERIGGGRQDVTWADARFYHTFQTAGWHSGFVETDPDNLDADNRRYFTLEIPETARTVPVLAVNGAPSLVPSQDELFFLRLAMEAAPEGQGKPFELTAVAPAGVAATLGHYRVSERGLTALRGDGVPDGVLTRLKDDKDLQGKEYDTAEAFLAAVGRALSPDEARQYRAELLNRARGGNYPLIVLANVDAAQLTEAGVERLEEYVDEGGKLLVFAGDKVSMPSANDLLAGAGRRHGGLLPGRFKGVNPVPGGHVKLPKFYEHRALAAFNEPKLRALLGPSLTFAKVLPVEAPPDAVLMETSKGLPLLCEKDYGKGKVLLFASTCDRDWTDFPARPAFLLWTRFVADYLTGPALGLQTGTNTGDAVRLASQSANPQATLYVRKPGGDKVAVPRAADGSGAFEFRDTAEPGVYAVLGADGETKAGLFAVNVEGYESALQYADDPESPDETAAARRARVEGELKAALGGAPLVAYLENVSDLEAALGDSRRGMKLWDIVLVVVLLIGLFEPWLANQISARLYARPREPAALAAGGSGARVGSVEPVLAEGAAR